MQINIPLKLGRLDDALVEYAISALIGMITPWIIAFFNKRKFTDRQRIVVGGMVSFVLAMIQCYFTGQLDTITSVAAATIIIWKTSQVTYRNVALKWGIRDFENATTPADQRVAESKPLSTSSTLEATAQVMKTAIEQPAAVAEQMSNEVNDNIVPEAGGPARTYTREQVHEALDTVLSRIGDKSNGGE